MKTIKKSELLVKLGHIVNFKNCPYGVDGRELPNQFDVEFENGTAFRSYDTIIAVKYNGNIYVSEMHDYSRATSRSCNKWLGYDCKERREQLKNERFILIEEDEN